MNVYEELQAKLESLPTIEERAYGLFEFWLANRGKYTEVVRESFKKIKLEAKIQNSNYALGWSYYILGWLESDQGNLYESFPYLEKAREKFEECGDKWALSNTMNGFAVSYSQVGTYDKAFENYLLALGLAEEVKDEQLISSIAMNIGCVLLQLNQYTEALYYFEEIAKDFSHVPSEKAIMLCNFGKAYKFLERYEEAEEKFREAISLNKGGAGEVYAYQELADLYKLQGHNEKAYEYNE